ncbi:hypothetical protein [Flavobacterium muglaense]|uniref:Uncharacterized protein n=1 Tax=Flavobacterium muglaense TaxID=2764716 RepID=A0A923SE78_9FLAO|nr:hypothetical protein [Flavobacterium muglaense]MBC5836798.1 hypothetical protein [Flavobacterium muglaense]MBC5843252.1 hypothetical protein [Flavobacterium muglaense]
MTITVTQQNLKKYQPFVINVDECGTTHQVDIDGIGVLNFLEPISPELLVEIRTNIDNQLTKYFEDIPVDPSTLGYTFNITPQNKLDRTLNAEIIQLSATFFVESIENGNNTAQLALIKIITLIILQEIMVLP